VTVPPVSRRRRPLARRLAAAPLEEELALCRRCGAISGLDADAFKQRGGAVRTRWPYAVLPLTLLIAACGEDMADVDPGPTHLFDTSFGMRISAEPTTPSNGDTLHLVLESQPRASGVGFCGLQGFGGGIGDALSPAEGEVGWVSIPVEFKIDTLVSVEWLVVLDTQLNSIGLDCGMQFDSVAVDGVLYSVNSTEARSAFGPDFVFRHIKSLILPVQH
jgi:hypothetical protein